MSSLANTLNSCVLEDFIFSALVITIPLLSLVLQDNLSNVYGRVGKQEGMR